MNLSENKPMITLTKAKKKFRTIMKLMKIHHKDLCCFKDHVAEHALEELIEEIFTEIAEDIPSVSPKRNPFRKPSNFNVGDMNGWDVCHVTWLDEIKQFNKDLLT